MASEHDQSIRVTSAGLRACEDSPHDEPSRLSGPLTVPLIGKCEQVKKKNKLITVSDMLGGREIACMCFDDDLCCTVLSCCSVCTILTSSAFDIFSSLYPSHASY
jgi:hypothetical protein